MKKQLLLLPACLFMTAVVLAQNTGKITYNEKVKLNLSTSGIDEQFKDLIPQEQNAKKLLYFNTDAALYENDKAVAKKPDEPDQQQGNVRIRIKMDVPDDKIYTDLKGKKVIEQRDFMSKQFLVTSDIEPRQWKLTGKEKQILGYPCQEAILHEGKDTIIAWFTAKIPVSIGPADFYGLPGLILEAVQNKQYYLEATNVELAPIDNALLMKPKNGKKVTKKEFEGIVEAKTKEMQQEYGGNGNVIIKVRR
jgi:GLPGLI family protein